MTKKNKIISTLILRTLFIKESLLNNINENFKI
jgi:hypothetical protein